MPARRGVKVDRNSDWKKKVAEDASGGKNGMMEGYRKSQRERAVIMLGLQRRCSRPKGVKSA
jgi:hypothetical protein